MNIYKISFIICLFIVAGCSSNSKIAKTLPALPTQAEEPAKPTIVFNQEDCKQRARITYNAVKAEEGKASLIRVMDILKRFYKNHGIELSYEQLQTCF